MAKIFAGEIPKILIPFRYVEKLCYRFSAIDSEKEMNWKEYSFALLVFNFFGFYFSDAYSNDSKLTSAQSTEVTCCSLAFSIEYIHQFYDEYQLASLCR